MIKYIDQIFIAIGAFVLSMGGGGWIVWNLSAFLGNHWANIKIEKLKGDIEKEVQVQVEKARARDEQNIHIGKVQFEKEFLVYQELSEMMVRYVQCCQSMTVGYIFYASGINELKDKEKEKEKSYNLGKEYEKKYSSSLYKNAPFIPEDLYDRFYDVYKEGMLLLAIYPSSRAPEYTSNLNEQNERKAQAAILGEKCSELINKIREYLIKLKVID
jgi:hypothetical protein